MLHLAFCVELLTYIELVRARMEDNYNNVVLCNLSSIFGKFISFLTITKTIIHEIPNKDTEFDNHFVFH